MNARAIVSAPVVTVRSETALKDVAALMAEYRASGGPVVDRSGAVIGVVSESDFTARMEFGPRRGLLDCLARWLGAARRLQARSASEFMTSRVVTAGPDATGRELVHLVSVHDVNRIPLVADGRIIGIVTRGHPRNACAPGHGDHRRDRVAPAARVVGGPRAIEVATAAGVVTLAGDVDTRSDAAPIERDAATVDGVVAVPVLPVGANGA